MFKFITNLLNPKKQTSDIIPETNSLDNYTVELFNKNRASGPKPTLCYAPYSNMFFDLFGKVHVCCISWKCSEFIKNKNIKEIWEGDKFNTLRNRISNNDLSYACDICNSHLKNHNFQLALIKMFDEFSETKSDYPKMMEFELANNCNLECVMCNNNFSSTIRANRDKLPPLPLSYNDSFVSQIEEFIPHLTKARFIGGEPFLIDIYYKIWDKIIEINPSIIISVSTNGTVLNERNKSVLEKLKFEIIFSIDSFVKETYEAIRINAKYNNVISNLKYFQDYCKKNNTNFNISVCPIRQNWREIPEIVKYCNNINAQMYFNTVVDPFDCALWPLSSNELNNIYNHLLNATITEANDIEKQNYKQYKDLINQIKVWKETSFKREQFNKTPDFPTYKTFKDVFVNKLTNYFNSIETLSKEEKTNNIDNCIARINSMLSFLPPDYNIEYLYSLIIDFDIKEISNKLLTAENKVVDTDMKSIISHHYYKFEL